MDIEHQVHVFALDPNLEDNVKKMSSEGWLLMPGVTPIAIYHTVRMKGAIPHEGHAPIAQINIDETKVQILRNGQLVDS